MFLKGSFVDRSSGPLETWMPFFCFMFSGLWLGGVTFVITYAVSITALSMWFVVYSKCIQAQII